MRVALRHDQCSSITFKEQLHQLMQLSYFPGPLPLFFPFLLLLLFLLMDLLSAVIRAPTRARAYTHRW